MEPNPPSGNWDDRLRRRDPAAADEVFARYARRLVSIAQQHLARRVAARVDGEDVVQSVFRTFFRRAQAGEFRIDSSAQLWQLLVRITVLKARAKGRYHTAGKRDASAEAGGDPDEFLAGAVAGEPGPAEAAELVDLIDTLLRGLPPEYARVLELFLSGDNVTQVADRLGMSRTGVYRMLKVLQDQYRMLRVLEDQLKVADPSAGPPQADDADPPPA